MRYLGSDAWCRVLDFLERNVLQAKGPRWRYLAAAAMKILLLLPRPRRRRLLNVLQAAPCSGFGNFRNADSAWWDPTRPNRWGLFATLFYSFLALGIARVVHLCLLWWMRPKGGAAVGRGALMKIGWSHRGGGTSSRHTRAGGGTAR